MDPTFVIAGIFFIAYGVYTIKTRKQSEHLGPRKFVPKALYSGGVRGRLGIGMLVCGIIMLVIAIIQWMKN